MEAMIWIGGYIVSVVIAYIVLKWSYRACSFRACKDDIWKRSDRRFCCVYSIFGPIAIFSALVVYLIIGPSDDGPAKW